MIKLDGISIGYGKSILISKADITFKSGKLTALVGVNGCGKTTLIKTIGGLLSPKSGSVFIDGKDVSLLSEKERAQVVSYLPQSRRVPDMTVGELVLHGRFSHLSFPRVYSENDRTKASEAMEKMGIKDLSNRPMYTLSGGMRQNAYVAMALAGESDNILLDEPTTFLDVSAKIKLLETLSRLAESGRTIIAVLHDLHLALEYADEIAVMHDRRIRLFSSADEVLDSGIIREVFGVNIISAESDGHRLYHFAR